MLARRLDADPRPGAAERHVRFPTLYRAYWPAPGPARAGPRARELILRLGGPGRLPRPSGLLVRILRGGGVSGSGVLGHPFGPWRIDLAFPAQKVAVEVDGWAWHVDVDRFRNDRRKQNALVRAGLGSAAVHLARPRRTPRSGARWRHGEAVGGDGLRRPRRAGVRRRGSARPGSGRGDDHGAGGRDEPGRLQAVREGAEQRPVGPAPAHRLRGVRGDRGAGPGHGDRLRRRRGGRRGAGVPDRRRVRRAAHRRGRERVRQAARRSTTPPRRTCCSPGRPPPRCCT